MGRLIKGEEGKRGVGNREWGVGNGEWGVGNREWGVGNGEWGGREERGIIGNNKQSDRDCFTLRLLILLICYGCCFVHEKEVEFVLLYVPAPPLVSVYFSTKSPI